MAFVISGLIIGVNGMPRPSAAIAKLTVLSSGEQKQLETVALAYLREWGDDDAMALHAHLVDFGGRKDEDLEALEEFFTDEPYVEVFT